MFTSICILSYKRPQMLIDCIESLQQTVDSPCEIIVNDDTGTNLDILRQFLVDGKISKLVVNAGSNRGVGRSFQNCIAVSEGSYIFKIDSDIIFKPRWLSTALKVMEENPDLAALSLFDYKHYDPEDKRFSHRRIREDCIVVNDFVSSAYGFRRRELPYDFVTGYTMPDDGFHQWLSQVDKDGLPLAITKKDYVTNQAFGEKSVYVTKQPDGSFEKTPTYLSPKLFGI